MLRGMRDLHVCSPDAALLHGGQESASILDLTLSRQRSSTPARSPFRTSLSIGFHTSLCAATFYDYFRQVFAYLELKEPLRTSQEQHPPGSIMMATPERAETAAGTTQDTERRHVVVSFS